MLRCNTTDIKTWNKDFKNDTFKDIVEQGIISHMTLERIKPTKLRPLYIKKISNTYQKMRSPSYSVQQNKYNMNVLQMIRQMSVSFTHNLFESNGHELTQRSNVKYSKNILSIPA